MNTKFSALLSAALLLAFSGAQISLAANIQVYSSAIHEGATVPKQYTGEGADVSPPIAWTNVPKEAKSLALTCEDPDAPRGTWFHWIIFNLSPKTQQLGQGVPKSAEIQGAVYQGTNDFGKIGYNGPMPPPGQTHRYQFKLVALNKLLPIKGGCSKAEFEAAIKGSTIAQGQMTAKYSR